MRQEQAPQQRRQAQRQGREIETIDEPSFSDETFTRGRHSSVLRTNQEALDRKFDESIEAPVAGNPQLSTLRADSLSTEAEVAVLQGDRERERKRAKKKEGPGFLDPREQVSGRHSVAEEPKGAGGEISQAMGVDPKVIRIAIVAIAVIIVLLAALLISGTIGSSLGQLFNSQKTSTSVSGETLTASESSSYEKFGTTPACSQGGGYMAAISDKLYYVRSGNIYRVDYANGEAKNAVQIGSADKPSCLNVYDNALYFLDSSATKIRKIDNAASVGEGKGSVSDVFSASGTQTFIGLCIEDGTMYVLVKEGEQVKVERLRNSFGNWSLDGDAETLQDAISATMAVSDDGIQVVAQSKDEWTVYTHASSASAKTAFTKEGTLKGTAWCVSVVGKQFVCALASAQSLALMTSGGSSSPINGIVGPQSVGYVSAGYLIVATSKGKVYRVHATSLSSTNLSEQLNPDGLVIQTIGSTRDGYYCTLLSDGTLKGYNPDTDESFSINASQQ